MGVRVDHEHPQMSSSAYRFAQLPHKQPQVRAVGIQPKQLVTDAQVIEDRSRDFPGETVEAVPCRAWEDVVDPSLKDIVELGDGAVLGLLAKDILVGIADYQVPIRKPPTLCRIARAVPGPTSAATRYALTPNSTKISVVLIRSIRAVRPEAGKDRTVSDLTPDCPNAAASRPTRSHSCQLPLFAWLGHSLSLGFCDWPHRRVCIPCQPS